MYEVLGAVVTVTIGGYSMVCSRLGVVTVTTISRGAQRHITWNWGVGAGEDFILRHRY